MGKSIWPAVAAIGTLLGGAAAFVAVAGERFGIGQSPPSYEEAFQCYIESARGRAAARALAAFDQVERGEIILSLEAARARAEATALRLGGGRVTEDAASYAFSPGFRASDYRNVSSAEARLATAQELCRRFD